jgi:hypothetical protein
MLEKEGIPAVPVITDAFESTATEMAELWGVPEFRFVVMPHPLASLAGGDIERRAEDLLDRVLGLLRGGQKD